MKSISIYENRASIEIETGAKIQFAVWDLEPTQHEDLENQFRLSFSLCDTFSDIERHMKLNGFDVTLEDIFTN